MASARSPPPSWTPRGRSWGWKGCERLRGAGRPWAPGSHRPHRVRRVRRLCESGARGFRAGRRQRGGVRAARGARARALAARVRHLSRRCHHRLGRGRTTTGAPTSPSLTSQPVPPTPLREVPVYREVFVPVDNSQPSDWALERAIELCRKSGGRITGNHVYAARLHDVRFRQRKIHDKLIEKGLQLIADSFLDQLGKKCEAAGVALTRQLLEGINYEEIVNEVNRGAGRLPGLIGFDPNR